MATVANSVICGVLLPNNSLSAKVHVLLAYTKNAVTYLVESNVTALLRLLSIISQIHILSKFQISFTELTINIKSAVCY